MVALVATAKREVLLRVHRHRLRPEDLEDAYSQATLELVALSRRGRAFVSRSHLANTLEQRFLARVQDRRRAISGRSPIAAAMEGAVPFLAEDEPLEIADTTTEPERLALARDELKRLLGHMHALTPDQRDVVLTQLIFAMRCEQFCSARGWTPEKYRKVAQRARARLRGLTAEEERTRECPEYGVRVGAETRDRL